MSEHYYSKTPSSASRPQRVEVYARGLTVELQTDAGVFSKQRLDFGTRLLIEAVSLPANARAVDLGCGYGVVTAVLARVFPDSTWFLLDVNDRAVELARQNVDFASGRTRIYQSDGFSAVPDLQADGVILNPPIRAGKDVVYRLFEESFTHLAAHGALWIVIHKKHGAPSAKAKLESIFGNVETVERDAGYHVFRCQKTGSNTGPTHV